jgi:hypothetical protein
VTQESIVENSLSVLRNGMALYGQQLSTHGASLYSRIHHKIHKVAEPAMIFEVADLVVMHKVTELLRELLGKY